MKWKFLAKTAGFLMALFSIEEIPIDAKSNTVNFSDDQVAKLKAQLGDNYAEKIINGFNQELKNMVDGDANLLAIKKELDDLVLEANLSEEEMKALEGKDGDKNLSLSIQAIKAKQTEMQETIQKLLKGGIGDAPEAIVELTKNNTEKVKHTATHLFGSNKAWDSVDRPWNARVVGLQIGATDYTDGATIEKLNGDLKLYFRQNPDEVKSLHRDTFGLPTFWPKRTKVEDTIATGTIATAEISQARKLPWLPKNKQLIKPEEGKIYPVQIDIEFVGYFLQQIEASWLNFMNKEGSQPYKDSFVKFLVSEIDKRARLEDRIATIKGVYVETPENATVAAKFINRQNGILYQAWKARDIDKKYRPFDVGTPTTTNIVDYVDNIIKALPHEVRHSNGLVFYLSEDWLRAYKRKYELDFGGNTDYKGYPETPKDYPNIKFEKLIDLAGTDFMFLTYDDNIEILENIPAEKSMYKFEYLKRMVYIWADYKMGVRFLHIGNVVGENDPDEFKVQTVWSNTVPVFPLDFYVPVYDDTTGKVAANFNRLVVDSGFATHITDFTGGVAGEVIKIKGDTTLAATTNVVHNASKIILAGAANFNLKSGGTLTLFVQADGKLKELARTAAPETAPVADVNFDDAVIDANEGEVFKFVGGTTTAITSILNGFEGKVIRIYGTNASGVDVTLADVTGNINVASSATLGTATDFIELVKVDGVWIETQRLIA